ncbi:unnamed protein product [Chrysodeixis includens]|uniref:Uncharacterized protein n=1 Tax=Chrysodeixis includens TaxID=689277 RepID=A0A9N8Q0J8_CHRIL|nr:unnamed protein product [Chrysodeixis includens]
MAALVFFSLYQKTLVLYFTGSYRSVVSRSKSANTVLAALNPIAIAIRSNRLGKQRESHGAGESPGTPRKHPAGTVQVLWRTHCSLYTKMFKLFPRGVSPPFAEEIKSGKVYWYGKTCAERRRAGLPINCATDTTTRGTRGAEPGASAVSLALEDACKYRAHMSHRRGRAINCAADQI